jgi:hypothetical protein
MFDYNSLVSVSVLILMLVVATMMTELMLKGFTQLEAMVGITPERISRHGIKMGFKFRGWIVWEAPPFPDLSDKRSFEERAKQYVFIARDGPLAGRRLELEKLGEKLPPTEGMTEAITVISIGDEGFCLFPTEAVAKTWGDYFDRPLGEGSFGPKYQGFWQRAGITS